MLQSRIRFTLMAFLFIFLLPAVATEDTAVAPKQTPAATKEIALTIDDLPFVGNSKNDPSKFRREKKRYDLIIEILKNEKVPVTGFVIAGHIQPGQLEWIQEFQKLGGIIGNHTFSHPNANRMATDKYIENIAEADKILAPMMSKPKYFRFPYLITGRNCEARMAIRKYLEANGYVIAPVTIDTKDFGLNARLHNVDWRVRKNSLPSFQRQYLAFTAKKTKEAEQQAMKKMQRPVKQIILVHMNTLNSYFLGDLIQMLRKQGYTFISLPEALKDPYYQKFESDQNCSTQQAASKE